MFWVLELKIEKSCQGSDFEVQNLEKEPSYHSVILEPQHED